MRELHNYEDALGKFLLFFNDTATTEIYPLSLHDALPIWSRPALSAPRAGRSITPPRLLLSPRPGKRGPGGGAAPSGARADRKSTRLNSSHANISYAVFCLKKKTPTTFFLPRREQSSHSLA